MTKEQYQWHCKTYADRIERFVPPMWEDIESNYVFGFTLNKEGEVFSVEIKVLIGKEKDTGLIRVTDKFGILYVDHATKENYEKACEIVRDLFKGEK